MGPPDLFDSSLRDAYFNADDVVLGVWFVVARRNNDDTGTGSVGVDADVHVGGGDEWYAMPLSKTEGERGDTKALLKSVTFTEERLSSKATRSHGDVLRRVESGDDVVIVNVQIVACGVRCGCDGLVILARFWFWFDFNIGSGHP